MVREPDTTSSISVVRAGQIVDELDKALRSGEIGLRNIPPLMRNVLVNGCWRRREIRTHKVVTFDRFIDFLTAKPLEGLGEDPDLIKKLLQDDPETLARFEQAIVAPHGGDRRSEDFKSDNVTLEKVERGNSRAYTLRRLAKDAPELFEEVTADRMSANKAAIVAGIRKPKNHYRIAQNAYKAMTPSQRQQFLEWTSTVDDVE